MHVRSLDMFFFVLANCVACSMALRAPGALESEITRIDVRMENVAADGVGTRVAHELGTSVVAPRVAAAQAAQPAGFLASGSIGRPLDSIVEFFKSAPVHVGEPDAQVQAASAVMREVAAEAGPRSPFLNRELNPDLSANELFCDRDYAQLCPEGFASVGGTSCAALASYDGPCAGEARSFQGLPASAKARWSMQCATSWPCKSCTRDFSEFCPEGWLADAASGTCSPFAGYAGPCSGPISFAGYNAEMLQQFSSSCGAFWPCMS